MLVAMLEAATGFFPLLYGLSDDGRQNVFDWLHKGQWRRLCRNSVVIE